MVATRSSSSRAATPLASTTSSSSSPPNGGPSSPTPASTVSRKSKASRSGRASRPTAASSAAAAWSHAPSRTVLLWLLVSLPLVAWDTGYVLGRPHTMPGGAAHYPLWSPYKLYGEVDGVYGFKAWHAADGFTAAQSALNVIESLMYAVYLYMTLRKGDDVVDDDNDDADHVDNDNTSAKNVVARIAAGPRRRKVVTGRTGALAVLVGFSAAVMTLSKTVLYWLKEYYCGFDNIGHNSALDLFFLWIIPNGAWLVGSSYMIFSLGGEIFDGLTLASKASKLD